jgi:hypothetical protein
VVAPSFRHGKGIRPLIDEKDLSPFLTEVTVSAEQDTPEVTTFQDNDRSFIPGLRDVTFAFDGLFAASTTPADDIVNYLDGALGGSTRMVVTVDVQASTGGRAWMLTGDQTTYDIQTPVDDVVSVSADVQGSHGYSGGRMLRPLAAATSTGSNSAVATPGTTSAGGTTGGGVGHFHLTAQSTITSVVTKIQHSTSGSTWADLIAFTAATAETFQRSTVSGTVKEQLRSTISTFTGGAGKSATVAVAFSRRVRT